MRLLISGFEPFGGASVNPTAKLVEALATLPKPANVEVRGVILPVTFKDAFAKLQNEIRTFDPDVVASFGLAGGRSSSIEFERVAINCLDADIPDNAGSQPRDLKIEGDGENAFFSTLPNRELIAALALVGVPAKISNSAGTYVCNYLLYKVLESNLRTRRKCGFIHVPFLPEQIVGKEGLPSMPWETLLTGFRTIVETLARESQIVGQT